MRTILLLPCILFLNVSFAACTKDSATENIAFSENGELIALYNKSLNCFKISQKNGLKKIYKIEGINTTTEFNSQISLDISKNGKLLLIGFNTSESSRAFSLRNAENFSEIRSFPAIQAIFNSDNSAIIFVSDYSDALGQKTNGLNIYKIDTEKTEEKFKNFIFSGPLIIKGDFVAAEIMKSSEIDSTRNFILLNTKNENWRNIE